MVLADSYKVTSAFTGEQGIKIVREENPDIVLLDINLPDLDGLEVLKRIMAIPAPPAVVMLTVYLIYNDLDKNRSQILYFIPLFAILTSNQIVSYSH